MIQCLVEKRLSNINVSYDPISILSVCKSTHTHAHRGTEDLSQVLHKHVRGDSLQCVFFFCSLLPALAVISNFPTMNLYILYPEE